MYRKGKSKHIPELTQEQLLNHVDAAIHLLESETGHIATTKKIQAYLQTMGYDEPLERIKWATDDLVAIEEKQEPTLSECPYCHQLHDLEQIQLCPLNPKNVVGLSVRS